MGGLSPEVVRLGVPQLPFRVRRDMGGLLLVCGCRLRRLRASVRRLRDLRLQLVVPLGCRLL